jgi:hypothetical protein
MDVRYSYCYMILVHLKCDRDRRILVMMAEKLPSEHKAFMRNEFRCEASSFQWSNHYLRVASFDFRLQSGEAVSVNGLLVPMVLKRNLSRQTSICRSGDRHMS